LRQAVQVQAVGAVARTTDWAAYELIQAEIFDHLLAAAHIFDLRVFQEPTGLDFSSYCKTLSSYFH